MWLCWKSSKPQKHRKPAPFGAGFSVISAQVSVDGFAGEIRLQQPG